MLYGHVVLRRDRDGQAIRLRAKTALILRLGWDLLDDGTGYWGQSKGTEAFTTTRSLPPSKKSSNGHEMRISFHPDRSGCRAGLASRFRITANAKASDLCRLARATQGDWCWMTDFDGYRFDREEWLERV